jgi:hypothetical protein
MRLRNGDSDRTAGALSLGRHDLVVERAGLEAERAPRVEVVGGVDRAARALVLTDRPVPAEPSAAGQAGESDATDWLNVAVPWMDGSFVRVLS